MRTARRKLATVVAAVALLGGCGWVGSDADTSSNPGGTGPTAPPPPAGPGPNPGLVVEGRPWRRGSGRAAWVAVARWGRRRSWRRARVPGVDARSARGLARSWARAGEFEHASIGAFVDLAADLRVHGAPGALVARCEAAAADERDHTARCFALASRYAGREVRPGVDAPAPTRRQAPPIAVLATEALRDGVVNEGAAAVLAAEQLRACTDPAAAEALAVIARDEATHAELGWSILEWCLDAGGAEVAAAVASTLQGLDRPTVPAAPAGVDPEVAASHGRAVPASVARRFDELVADTRRRARNRQLSASIS